ncbi:hypothetical protein L210DRAFT_3157783 [Boletus edulis BED1]|uniref:Uncharacterized protein n=1 Tax=Boletus edulis BED1 TaxID=1328754 RepID=A0AAD4GGL1_BOLED|nr:hypothetical protein L210DRAFT_3157783 [Boletus edulis BED1]
MADDLRLYACGCVWDVLTLAFLCCAGGRGVCWAWLYGWESVADWGVAEGRAAECLCKGGEGLWDGHVEEEGRRRKKRNRKMR